jgi:hypothetical protein
MTNESCPDCGLVLPTLEEKEEDLRDARLREYGFDCSRCHTHYSYEDFKSENRFKTSKRADLESEG